MYGLNKLYLLMEKQHNRGQDGAGVATVKLNVEPGHPFLHRLRSNAPQPIADIFSQIGNEVRELEKYQPDITKHPGLMGSGNIFRPITILILIKNIHCLWSGTA